MSSARGNWLNAAIVLLACASAAVVWATRDAVGTNEASPSEQSLLPEFRTEDVTSLELGNGAQRVTLERTQTDGGAASFRLVQPVRELADAATVEKLLSALASARRLRPVEQGPALSAFGLDKPALQVKLGTAKRSYRIALGGPAPTPQGARYAQISSDEGSASIVVVGKSLAEDLALELDAFRQRSLVPLDEAGVTRISIESPELALTLERSTGSNFLIHGAPPVQADRDTVNSLFFQLSRLSASRFLSAAEAEAALASGRARVELQTKDANDTVRLELGGSCPGDASELVVIRRSPNPQSACAAREIEATLHRQRADFVDLHPFSLHVDEVEELDITGGNSKFALVRKGSGFLLHTSRDAPVELEAGNQRILALLEAQGQRVETPQLAELGLEPARSRITLHSSAARDRAVIQQVVRVGNKDASGNLLVYREQDGVVLRVPRERAHAFSIDNTLLYARKLTEFGLSSFISAEISGTQARQVLRRAANQELQLEVPPGFDVDGVLSSDLIQALGALTAERFVADRDDGSFGLSSRSLSVRFAFKDGEGHTVEHHLRFGDETPLGVFASLEDDGPVFILPRAVRDACDTLLIKRAIFPASPESLAAVTLEARGRTLRLERKGERLLPVPAAALSEAQLAAVLEAIGNLRPEAGLHTGPARSSEGFSKPSLMLRLVPRSSAPLVVTFGAGDSWRETRVFYLRVSGVDATFVMAQSKVRALSDAL